MTRLLATTVVLLAVSAPLRAGVYIPAEPPLVIEKDLSKFLVEQLGFIRGYGPPDPLRPIATAHREAYLAKVKALREKQAKERLSAEELASLGGYLIRLRRTADGIPDLKEAVDVLEAARRQHRQNFYILANLGTAYQTTGLYDLAENCLHEAEALAPAELRSFTRFQLRLVRLRQREQLTAGMAPLDDLFVDTRQRPVRFVGENGEWTVGSLAAAEQQKLPNGSLDEAVAVVQELLFCFPADARLHWMLGELANARGDLRAAARALNLAVDDFRLSTPALRRRRVLLNEAAAWYAYFERIGDAEKQQAWLLEALAAGMQPALPTPDLGQIALSQHRLARLSAASGFGEDTEDTPQGSPALAAWEALGWKAYAIVVGGGALILLLLFVQFRQALKRRRKAVARAL